MSGPPSQRVKLLGRLKPRPHSTTSGMLLAGAAAPFGVIHGAYGSLLEAARWLQALAGAASVFLLIAAMIIARFPRSGRIFATIAIVCVIGLGLPHLTTSPLAALAALTAGTTALVLLWKLGGRLTEISRVLRRPHSEGQTQGAALVAVALWFLWAFTDADQSVVDTVVVGWGVGCSALLSLEWALRHKSSRPRRALILAASLGGELLLVPLLWGHPWWVMSAFMGSAIAAAILVRRPPRMEMEQGSWWEPLLGHPERLFVGTFAALSLGGTIILALPQSSAAAARIDFVDAAFTATSAVCVTGLTVLDTSMAFSGFGQLAILALIQVGGLGIMTFSTVTLWALGRRMSLRHEGAVASLISTQDRGRLYATAKRIMLFTFGTEAAGAVILAGAFLSKGDSFFVAVWRGIFTSISAFCNAGFALQVDSLVSYQSDPTVLHTVAVLIILGGLSPLVVFSLPAILTRSSRPVPAQARIAVLSAVVLLLGGTFFMLAFEWNASLRGLSFLDKVQNAWFQSVTLRTAGFNSVDITYIRPATMTFMLLWMFIGGSPGSTAGGVKTTTIYVLLLSVVQAIRGQWTLEAFGKTITERTRAKAAVTVAIAAITGVMAVVAIQLTQRMSNEKAVFEVVSALGTVGLTIGGTAQLDGIGKAIIITCMFVGRVGGLTLLMFLSSRRALRCIGRPEEEIDVG